MAYKNYDEFAKELERLLADEVNDEDRQDQERRKAEIREMRRQREIAKKRKKRRNFLLSFLFFSLLILAGGLAGVVLYQNSLAYSVCRVEAGGKVIPSDFLKKVDDNAVFTDDSDVIDTTVPGEYYVEIKTGAFTTSSILIVEDTIAPVVELCDLKMAYGETCVIDDFITKLQDVTEVSCSYVTEPDFSQSGKQTVTIMVTDLGGNVTRKDTQLWLMPVIPTVHVELGSILPSVSDLVVEGVTAEYVTAEVDCNTVGTYPVTVLADGVEYEVNFVVEDTTAPELIVQAVSDFALLTKLPQDFVVSAEDISGISSVTFKAEPDWRQVGSQHVVIVAEDTFGNQTEKVTVLDLIADEEAPVFTEAEDFVVYIGDTVAYKSKVQVTDNCPADVTIKVDATGVDLKTEGKYPVVYTATDLAGNVSEKILTVTVKVYRADEEELNQKIDAIFETIFKDDMTNREKCQAIYDYIRRTVSYVSYSEKGDYIKAAMEGLNKGKGDCYVYFALSKAMLDRAGFPNLDIERIRVGDSMHFWNLVDIGDGHGWYHFDTTPRVDGPYIFLWDDEKMWEYSDSHKGSHNYDKSLYPEIN